MEPANAIYLQRTTHDTYPPRWQCNNVLINNVSHVLVRSTTTAYLALTNAACKCPCSRFGHTPGIRFRRSLFPHEQYMKRVLMLLEHLQSHLQLHSSMSKYIAVICNVNSIPEQSVFSFLSATGSAVDNVSKVPVGYQSEVGGNHVLTIGGRVPIMKRKPHTNQSGVTSITMYRCNMICTNCERSDPF